MATTAKTKRRIRLAVSGAAVALLGGIAALTIRAVSPQWRTYMLPAEPKTDVTIAIDYPDDWIVDPHMSRPKPIESWVQFVMREPNPLVKWCREHLMGQRTASKLPTTVRFTCFPNVTSNADELEAVWASHNMSGMGGIFDQTQVRRYQHRLGPELEITQHIARLPIGTGTLDATSYQATIFLNDRDPAHRMTISGSCFASGDASLIKEQFREVVARIHLVTR